MCSLCRARKKQLEEKRERSVKELEEDARYLEYVKQKDAEERDVESHISQGERPKREHADRENRAMIDRKTRTMQESSKLRTAHPAAALRLGHVAMGDVFRDRHEEDAREVETGEKQKLYGTGLKSQMREKEEAQQLEREKDMQLGLVERENARRAMLGEAERARQLKAMKDQEKRETLDQHIRERAPPLPKTASYGKAGDIFTQQESEEEIAARREANRVVMQGALSEQIRQRKDVQQSERERAMALGREAVEQERRMLEEEAEREIERRKRSEDLAGAALRRQMEQKEAEKLYSKRREDELDAQMQNVFVRGEGDPEEMLWRKRAQERETALQLERMEEDRRRRMIAQKEADKEHGRWVREMDKAELERDKLDEQRRREYTEKMHESLRQQIVDKRQESKRVKEESRRAVAATTIAFPDDEEDDCEEPKYRRKPMTKQQRLAMGGW
jgi:hypothetical protein